EPLAPLTMTPTFPYAMCEPLKEAAQELFAPGLETIPPNTVGLLISNQRFIEAYMVGLNHEMSREMLWQEYPAQRDGTYFQYFWTTPRQTELSDSSLQDIQPINTWIDTNKLGQNAVVDPAETGSLVLLIRGEVLRRYPTASVYAVQAKWIDEGQSAKPRYVRDLTDYALYPSFRGRLEPDITYLGFDLDVATPRGSIHSPENPGWFFVFRAQPVEPRFGLDVAGSSGNDWSDLSWSDVSIAMGANHLSLTSLPEGVDHSREGITWGVNAAQMAFIPTRLSSRIAVHADTMLLAQTSD